MVLQTVLSSGEIEITENWDILKIVTTKEKAEGINVGDVIEYVPSWSEYKLSDLDRQMYEKGFRFKRILVAKNNDDIELVNELLPVYIDTATPISEGKMRDDCGDLRFYWWNEDSQIWEEISYWIDNDTVNTSSTKIILRIPKVEANGYVNIVAYYGAKHYGRKDDLTIGFGNRSSSGKYLSFDGVDDYVELVNPVYVPPEHTIIVIASNSNISDSWRFMLSGKAVQFDTSGEFVKERNIIWFRGLPTYTHGEMQYSAPHYYYKYSDGTYAQYLGSWAGVATLTTDKGAVEDNFFIIAGRSYGDGRLDVYFDNGVDSGLVHQSADISNDLQEHGDHMVGFNITTIGANPSHSKLWHGKVFAVLAYSRALSDEEIQQIYENPNDPPRAGLVLWLAPDSVDDVNGKWLDKSGLGNDGTINGATPVEVRTFEESVQTSKVMSFDGVDDYVITELAGGFNNNMITVELLINFDKFATDGSNHLIYGLDSGGVSYYWIDWYFGVTLFSIVRDGAGNTIVNLNKHDFPIQIGKWYHIVVVHNMTNGDHRLYVDGELVATKNVVESWPATDLKFKINGDSGRIGGRYGLVRVWNRALSDTEVQNLYNDPNNPPLDGLVLWLDGTSIDEANGKWLNKAPALKSGYVEPLDGVIYGATPTDLLSSVWSEEIDMNNGLRIVWRGKVVKKIVSGNSVVLYVRTNNLGKLIGEVV